MLNERGSQLSLVQRDTDHHKSQYERLQESIRHEKVLTVTRNSQIVVSKDALFRKLTA